MGMRDRSAHKGKYPETSGNHPKDQTIFTRYIAAEHPVGTWKTYNELNRKINENPWMNELMDGIKEAAESYPVYDKSTYSSFQVPTIRKAAQKADRVILTGVVSECCVLSTFFEGIDLGCKLIWLTDATSGLNPVLEEETLHILQGLSPLHVEFLYRGLSVKQIIVIFLQNE